jgi:hypothetical protein
MAAAPAYWLLEVRYRLVVLDVLGVWLLVLSGGSVG